MPAVVDTRWESSDGTNKNHSTVMGGIICVRQHSYQVYSPQPPSLDCDASQTVQLRPFPNRFVRNRPPQTATLSMPTMLLSDKLMAFGLCHMKLTWCSGREYRSSIHQDLYQAVYRRISRALKHLIATIRPPTLTEGSVSEESSRSLLTKKGLCFGPQLQLPAPKTWLCKWPACDPIWTV